MLVKYTILADYPLDSERTIMMDWKYLADKLFPHIVETPEQVEARYPKRNLPEGAKVTRMGPSPTGFMHLGNLYGALVDERLAHQSGGVFYLRIEDTDRKREVEGGVQTIIDAFSSFDLPFDEGATLDGETGAYGPYRQSQRAEIYQTFVKHLMARGMAYPCFCTEEELSAAHAEQEKNKENFGYYGKYAIWRDRTLEDIEAELAKGTPYVVRFRSEGSIENKIRHEDLVKGKMEVTENDQDVVILKSDGIPTYHFAHVVDDHLMGTTIVVRGEEWLATLPVHLQLFRAMGWKAPKYAHTAQLMKIDEETGGKRKLSKRKDPELALTYYAKEGYPAPCVLEYLMTLLNSNFEEWRRANPDAPMNDFPFSTKKMSGSGALFDIAKLKDVSKNVISHMTAERVYNYVAAWSEANDPAFHALFTREPDKSRAFLAIGRGGKKPRKDLALWTDVKPYMDFLFDELFQPDYTMPARVSIEDAKAILDDFAAAFDENDTPDGFFDKMKEISEAHGYASDTKAYKQNPDQYKGAVGDVSMVVRVAVAGRQNAPDLQSVMHIMGREQVLARLEQCKAAL
jgi:glutamyl-tRNA synthetase